VGGSGGPVTKHNGDRLLRFFDRFMTDQVKDWTFLLFSSSQQQHQLMSRAKIDECLLY
jgi:hypothetical protein